MGERSGPMYDMLRREAREIDLPLNWPIHLPNSQYALIVAEQVRRHIPEIFPGVKDRIYAAHFALGEDVGSKEVVHHCLGAFGIGAREIGKWLKAGRGLEDLTSAQHGAESVGVRGTPAWVLKNQLISGLQPSAYFQQFRGGM